MKKFIFLFFFTGLFSLNRSQAQITLEHVYDSASVHLYMVHLEVDGDKYIWRDLWYNRRIVLYNLDHSIFRIMPLPANVHMSNVMPGILYVTQNLFNTDNIVEYMLAYQDTFTYVFSTKIIDESGNIIFNGDSLYPYVVANAPQQQLPIYNTSDGTKMILSDYYSTTVKHARVYSLGGTLSTSIQSNVFPEDLPQLNVYPNPSYGYVQLDYNLPPGITFGEIVLYDVRGAEQKRFRVDSTFDNIHIDTGQLPPGTFYYQLVTKGGVSGTKKMIIISH